MNKLLKLAVCMALPVAGAMFVPVASATVGTATTTVPVTATVIDSCTVEASPVLFGNYNGISGAALDAVAIVSPTCTVGTAYSIDLSAGLGNDATHTTRKLTGPDGAALAYSIYTDISRTTVWGNGTAGTATPLGVGAGVAQSVMMYGRVPAAQSSMVGSYADTITVTVAY
ncbi:MAG: spore coat U domain-containing protein [Betaproteobacteria bacterium]